MSLLWIHAAWYHEKPGTEEWGEHGFDHETREQRRDRYLQHIQNAHGVDRESALRAARVVQSSPNPVEAGFASQPSGTRHPVRGSEDDGVWANAPIEDVDLSKPVHATQNWLHQRHLFHNLFHPGKKPPSHDPDAGHPDIDPDEDRDEEDEAYWDRNDNGHPLDLPRMIRQTEGSHVVHDGHHRVAADMLLGKATTRARVLDIRDLLGRRES
jgi:hypothetical protein